MFDIRGDVVEHRVQIFIHINIRNSNDSPAAFSEVRIPPAVMGYLRKLRMCSAIYLHDEPGGYAGEVGDIGAYGMLPAEW